MTNLFLTVLRLSASASILAAVVLCVRFLLRKAPRWLHVALWAMVAVRLVMPVSIESRFSQMPEAVTSGNYIEQWQEPSSQEAAAMPAPIESTLVVDIDLEEEKRSPFPLLAWLWAAGVAAMGIYTAVSYFRLKQQLSTAVRLRGNVYLSEKISSPFVLGVFRPRIYLPSRLDGSDLNHVLAHERSHIHRGDHLWKPLGFVLLSFHWFNPVMWLCYILLCRDIELACDEKVVKALSESDRADYSQALLNCAVSHRTIAACPIAFGEVGVKQRVKNVLSYKKPGFWILLISLVLCIVLAVSFLTDPVQETKLMDQVMAQDGYFITNQESKTINLVIEKDSLTEECFTEEGCYFSPGVVVPYHTMADNTLYLKHVCLDGEWLELTFDFTDSEYRSGKMLLPWFYDTKTGYMSFPATEHTYFEVWDNHTTYPEAAIVDRIAKDPWFAVSIKYSVYQQAEHHIAFALNDFNLLSYQKGEAPPVETEPEPDVTQFHIFPTEVTPTGMTVLNLPDGAWQSREIVTELNYYLEQEVNGQWVRLAPHSEEGLPIGDKNIHTVIDTDTDRHLLDWSTLYGVLPSGSYRVGIDYYFKEEGTKSLYANFTIDDSMNPASFLSTMTADARRCSAEFPPDIQQQYTFNKNQDAQLISILNTLQPEEFFVGAAVNPKLVVTISHQASPVWLYWDGQLCQFSFTFDDTRWAVRNDKLNDFLETILEESPANSTYTIQNTAPLNEIPDTYTQEEAAIDNVVILNEGDVRANNAVWETFLLSANSRIPASVRIMKYYSATDGQKAVKNVYDLEFDGNSYYLHYAQNGAIQTVHYHNLCRRSAENVSTGNGLSESYAFYFLTNEDRIDPTKKVRENDRFAKPGDDPFMVWCDFSLRQDTLPIPEFDKVTLEVDLVPIITVTDPAVLDTIEFIFSELEACEEPDGAAPGPVLRFHNPKGTDLSLMLDLEQDYCTFNGQYFYYGKPGFSILEGLWKLLGLDYWPDQIVEHDAFAWHFGM